MYLVQTKTHLFKIIRLGLSFVLIFSGTFPGEALASRSKAGGGDLAEFDFSKLAISAGITLGSLAIGSVINSAVSAQWSNLTKGTSFSVLSAMKDSLAKSFSVNSMLSGLSTFSAVSQVGRAAATVGNYYGLSPSTTLIISNAASSATAGFLNPDIALGDAIPQSISLASESVQSAYYAALPTMAKGALVGGLTGLASSGAVVAIDAEKINEMKEPGIPSQIAGLVAGVAAGNFARELVNPSIIDGKVFIREDKIEKIYAEPSTKAMLGIDTEASFTSQEYFLITEASPKIVPKTELLTGPALNELQDNLANNDYKKIWIDKDTLYLGKPGISAQGLFTAGFIKTGDMWPQLTGRALAITATSLLGRDNQFASLAGSLVEGITTPVFSGLAEYYALRPGLYTGEERILNNVVQHNSLYQSGYKVALSRVEEKGRTELEKYQKGLITKDEYRRNLEKIGNQALEPFLEPFKDKRYSMQGADDWESMKNDLRASLKAADKKENAIEDILAQVKEQDLPNQLFTKMVFDIGPQLEAQIKKYIKQGKPPEETLRALGTNRFALSLDSVKAGMKFGLVEGAVYGGVSSLTSQLSKNDPLAGAAGAYAASLLTGAIRGVLWYKTWKPGLQDGNLVWSDRYTLPKPEPYQGDDWWQREFEKVSYARDAKRFNDFVAYLGLEAQEDKIPALFFKDKPEPNLTIAVLASLAQTNREFTNRMFAFGAPQIKPEHINTFIMSDYLSQVNGYAISGSRPGWFSAGLTSGLLNAGSLAISNNLLTSLAAIKSTADALGIQRQRLTLTNSPLTGVTIQTLDYLHWAISLQTGFYLPFPSDVYRARSITGESFIKDK